VVVQSTHKTLTSLSQTAMMHMGHGNHYCLVEVNWRCMTMMLNTMLCPKLMWLLLQREDKHLPSLSLIRFCPFYS